MDRIYKQAKKLSRAYLIMLGALLLSTACLAQISPQDLDKIVPEYLSKKHPADNNASKTVSLSYGTVTIPQTGTSKRTGTIDSERGEIRYDDFLIIYDIGKMAGGMTSAVKKMQDTYPWYYQTVINGNEIDMALYKSAAPIRLHITVWTKDKVHNTPIGVGANFSAVATTRVEVEKLLAVALSYQPNDN